MDIDRQNVSFKIKSPITIQEMFFFSSREKKRQKQRVIMIRNGVT